MAKFGSYGNGCRCAICGSELITNTFIGSSCQMIYNKSKRKILNEKSIGLEKYKIEAEYFMGLFSQIKTNFRNDFKKSFFKSMNEQCEASHRISKKQLDIVKNMVFEKNDPYACNKELEKLHNKLIDSYENRYKDEILLDAQKQFLIDLKESKKK